MCFIQFEFPLVVHMYMALLTSEVHAASGILWHQCVHPGHGLHNISMYIHVHVLASSVNKSYMSVVTSCMHVILSYLPVYINIAIY